MAPKKHTHPRSPKKHEKSKRVMRILFAASEAVPLAKTGGLGDVAGTLPSAIRALKSDVRVVMPAYRGAIERLRGKLMVRATLNLGLATSVRILEGVLPGSEVPVWLIDAPALFDRSGGPYVDEHGHDWPDNALRFAVFAKAIEEIALDRVGFNWEPDIVHCNDWQTGLVPPLLARHAASPATVFTIHNLAYQGIFNLSDFTALQQQLGLPAALWHVDSMEFYGNFCFMKGGLMAADMLSTVSPTYAEEIRTKAFGHGMEGLLTHRADDLVGILNGMDYSVWNPAKDEHIPHPYDSKNLDDKRINKRELQKRFGLPVADDVPLIGMVGRMAHQKGIDLVLEALPELVSKYAVQFAVVGSGEAALQKAFKEAATWHPEKIAVHIGFSEELAHLVEAGADMFLMPSRYEPCGLNQMYSLRYGAVPIVRKTGGLADTVRDATEDALNEGAANGFCFDEASSRALKAAVERAIHLYHQPAEWRRLMLSGMADDYSWARSASAYVALYETAMSRQKDRQSPA